jgi:hypothetical protein
VRSSGTSPSPASFVQLPGGPSLEGNGRHITKAAQPRSTSSKQTQQTCYDNEHAWRLLVFHTSEKGDNVNGEESADEDVAYGEELGHEEETLDEEEKASDEEVDDEGERVGHPRRLHLLVSNKRVIKDGGHRLLNVTTGVSIKVPVITHSRVHQSTSA